MLATFDIGNTNIAIGVYDGDDFIASFRMTTKSPRTSDEFGIAIVSLLQAKNISPDDITDVIVSSVVPNIMHSFNNSIRKFLNVEPMIVGPGIKTGLAVHTDNPSSVGADRIVDAVAAYDHFHDACLVLDFGTATTFDYVTEKGVFEYGVTVPGIEISGKALWEKAAQLPQIEIKKPDTILAKNTVTSMQAGLVYGYIGATEYIIDQMKKEIGRDCKVIATGGLGKVVFPHTDKIDEYDGNLAYKGMKLIWEKNKK